MTGVRQGSGLLALAGIALAFALGGTAQAAKPGQLDRSFGHDGTATTEFKGGLDANAVAIDSHGRIVVAGIICTGSSDCSIGVARFKPNGTLDPSFGGFGEVVTHFDDGLDQVKAMAVDAQDRIVVAGRTCSGELLTTCSFALARYKPDGSLDASFDGDGKLRTKLGGGATAVAIDSQNRIVAAGWGSDLATYQGHFALARYQSNGKLDLSFGIGGKATTAFGPTGHLWVYNAWAYSMGIDSQGRIVIGGFRVYADEEKYSAALARSTPGGDPDVSFSGDGKLARNGGVCCQVVIDAHDRIVVGGAGLARYNTDGTLDHSFGGDGKVKNVEVRKLAIDSEGRIVAVSDHHLARRKPNGQRDRSFGGDGEVAVRFHRKPRSQDFATSEAIDAQDRIVVAGVSRKCAPSCADALGLARYIG
ncbi:MAG: hypothetical protein ACRDMH_12290 [Solirubrobacterales bacterium]